MKGVAESVAPWMGPRRVVGAVTLVYHDGRVVHEAAHGHLARETGAPMPVDAIFRIYSMTKPITSLALMMLVDRGRVALERPLADYLPSFADLAVLGDDGEVRPCPAPPTVADVLRHTAGFDYRIWETPVGALYREKGVWDTTYTLAETIDRLAALPLAYAPGTRWHYSAAPDVAAAIVVAVAGRPFDDFLREEIFEPLIMADTGFYVAAAKQSRFTALYGGADWAAPATTGRMLTEAAQAGEHHLIASARDSLESGPHHVIRGGTGLVSTAQDYLRFCQLFLHRGEVNGRRLISAEAIDLMTARRLPPAAQHHFEHVLDQPGQSFGFGFRVQQAAPSFGSVGEISWWGAANTSFWIDPARRVIGVQMSQFMPPGIFPLGDAFKRAVYSAL